MHDRAQRYAGYAEGNDARAVVVNDRADIGPALAAMAGDSGQMATSHAPPRCDKMGA